MPKQQIWDPSVIGIPKEDMEWMDPYEQRSRCIEEINRAADIMQAVISAFRDHMTPEQRAEIAEAARMAIKVARAMDT